MNRNTAEELFAKKQCKSFEAATDETIEALRRQLKKHKGKQFENSLPFQDLAFGKGKKNQNVIFFNSSKFENLRNPSKNQRENA